jgi:methyltransferase (TIGR00027 family)
MHAARPSHTAEMVAMRRAAHQVFDGEPKVLADPLAVRILGTEAEARMRNRRQQHPFAKVGRAFIVARSRFAEDELAHAVERGVMQLVVLGAGLDTFAYRNPYPALRIFEVDHPATQAWKQERLIEGGIAIPANVTYVPVNFERETLAHALRAAGLDEQRPAFFSWLGVTMYLTDEAIDATLRYIGSRPPGSGLVLDYSLPSASLTALERFFRSIIARRVAKAGEPFINFFTPQRMSSRLEAAGLHRIEDLGSTEMNARYFHGRTDRLEIKGRSLHLASARV